MVLWSTRTEDQPLVVWHSSQVLLLAMWVEVLPVAFIPLWQAEHEPVTEAWSKRVELHRLVVWHRSHELPLMICLDGLPVALEPLWQLKHGPVTRPWSKRSAAQLLVEWQKWQVFTTGMWFAPLPLAILPLWHVAHGSLTWLWSMRTVLLQALVVWHSLQSDLVGICMRGFPVAVLCLLFVWHPIHRLGVPLNMPLAWQLSHLTVLWAPVRSKPVLKWLKLNFFACAAPAGPAEKMPAENRRTAIKTATLEFPRTSLICFFISSPPLSRSSAADFLRA
jgi:hypothetical protein